MSAAGAARVPSPSAVSMGALLAACAAASAVSTPPARERVGELGKPGPAGEEAGKGRRDATDSEAA
ncbi:hypothetical protein OG389_23050 [Streptomyces sp. NBC_00435]|uniref:hypothetical protein n=1 Tax=Streptomyces sp. NBC_00435 TaxID=2903649 RepID=UPI002E1B5954